MPSELLPKVDLWQISGPAMQALEEMMRRVLAEQGRGPAASLGAVKAAEYVGVSRNQFLKLRKEDPGLEKLSFLMGTKPYWRAADLDAWMQRRSQAASGGPLEAVAASASEPLDEAA